jgi:hypothetical protein
MLAWPQQSATLTKGQNAIYRFFNARDSILGADSVITGGENKCELWSGFAERGLVSSIILCLTIAGPFLNLFLDNMFL